MISVRQKIMSGFAFLALLIIFSLRVSSHCEIPCGIYDDEMRIEMISEDIDTVEKSMNQIMELTGDYDKNFNQIVRWIQNKEKHANRIMHTVTQYFMTQRLKPIEDVDSNEYKEYVKKLTLLHRMMFYSMKSKQTTDLNNVEKLRSLLESFRKAYFGHEEHHH